MQETIWMLSSLAPSQHEQTKKHSEHIIVWRNSEWKNAFKKTKDHTRVQIAGMFLNENNVTQDSEPKGKKSEEKIFIPYKTWWDGWRKKQHGNGFKGDVFKWCYILYLSLLSFFLQNNSDRKQTFTNSSFPSVLSWNLDTICTSLKFSLSLKETWGRKYSWCTDDKVHSISDQLTFISFLIVVKLLCFEQIQ